MKKTILAVLSVVALAGGMNAQTIYQRQEYQQERIAQGVYSGRLSPGETAYLEHREAGINHEIQRDRFFNGGRLTAGERYHIQAQQNRLSNQIYREKHDGWWR